jgi:DNA polymerase III subunit gamma/tau
MSYQVLARKYRPQTFDEVIAQEHVTKTLKNALLSGRVGSGYLFCGPRGTGKTSVARILAKSINCDQGPTVEPCGECDSCRTIGGDGSLDVREIDAASNTGVDDVRVLRENIRYGPSAENRKRIYIIDEVHRLSGAAFDALLKTLEEPPSHAMFIFATTDPQKVPDTIHSRTQRFDFRRVNAKDLAKALGAIAGKEGVTVSEDALRLIARRGDGSVRDSVSLLDQIISFSSHNITAEQVIEALGLIDQEFLYGFVEALARGDCASALIKVAELADSGADIREFIRELSHHIRSLTILRSAGLETATKVLNLIESELERLQSQLDFYTVGDLVRLADILNATTRQLKDIEPRWALEMATVKMAYLESTVTIEEALAQLQAAAQTGAGIGSSGASGSRIPGQSKKNSDLFAGARTKLAQPERNFRASPGAASNPSPGRPESLSATATSVATAIAEKPTTSTTSTDASPPAQGLDLARLNTPTLRQHWPAFLASLKGPNRMLATQLAMATVLRVEDNCLTLLFPGSALTNKSLVEKSAYRTQIEQELKEFFGAPLRINYEIEAAPAQSSQMGQTGQATQAPSHASERSSGFVDETGDSGKLLAEDECLRNLVEQVDGEIVRVREIKNQS